MTERIGGFPVYFSIDQGIWVVILKNIYRVSIREKIVT